MLEDFKNEVLLKLTHIYLDKTKNQSIYRPIGRNNKINQLQIKT